MKRILCTLIAIAMLASFAAAFTVSAQEGSLIGVFVNGFEGSIDYDSNTVTFNFPAGITPADISGDYTCTVSEGASVSQKEANSFMVTDGSGSSIYSVVYNYNYENGHGEYLEFFPTGTGTATNATEVYVNSNKNSGVAAYDADTASFKNTFTDTEDAREGFKLSTAAVKGKYNYVKMLEKYENVNVETGKQLQQWSLGVGTLNGSYKEKDSGTLYPIYAKEFDKWRYAGFDISRLATLDTMTTYENIPLFSQKSSATHYLRYLTLFENADDAQYYDDSVRSASFGGINGNIDRINHIITINMPMAATESEYTGITPVITTAAGAAVEPVGEFIFNSDTYYKVTDIAGRIYYYTLRLKSLSAPEDSYVLAFDTEDRVKRAMPEIIDNGTNLGQKYVTFDANNSCLDFSTDGKYSVYWKLFFNGNFDLKQYRFAKVKYKVESWNPGWTLRSRIAIGDSEPREFRRVGADDSVNKWFTEMLDISAQANTSTVGNNFNFGLWTYAPAGQTRQTAISGLKIKYIAFFKDYEDAVKFDGEEPEPISIVTMGSTATAVYDCINTKAKNMNFCIAAYKQTENGAQLVKIQRTPVTMEDPMQNNTSYSLDTQLDLSSLADGDYIIRAFLWNDILPYTVSADKSVQIEGGYILNN